jgi:hypothetical protein
VATRSALLPATFSQWRMPRLQRSLLRGGNLTCPASSVLRKVSGRRAGGAGPGHEQRPLFRPLGEPDRQRDGQLDSGTTPWRGHQHRSLSANADWRDITAQGNFQLSNLFNNSNLDIGAVTIATPNGPVVARR